MTAVRLMSAGRGLAMSLDSPVVIRPVVALFLALGVALRLRTYLANRSLWLDESGLALNILNRDFAGLLRPLDHSQAAPVGFLFVERVAVDLFGTSEYALRLFPLLCGIASVLLFWQLARQVLRPFGMAIAVAIFATGEVLVYYSGEAKPYSSDVAIAILLWWMLAVLAGRSNEGHRHAWLLAAAIGAIAIWLSYPAVFVLGGIGLSWLGRALWLRAWRDLVVRGLVGLAWAGSFAVAYFTTIQAASEHMGLRLGLAVRKAAAPLMLRSTADFRWFGDAIWTLGTSVTGRRVLELVLVLILIGVWSLWWRGRSEVWWFAGALLLTCVASGLEKYPLAIRLWLFLVPAVILIAAAGVDEIWERTKGALNPLAVVLAVLLLAYPLQSAIRQAVGPHEKEEVRPLLEHVRQRYQEGDVLYIYDASVFAVRYYAARGLGFPGETITGSRHLADYDHEVSRLGGRNRVWLLFSHVRRQGGPGDDVLILERLDRIGRQVAAQRRTGASLYLYELSRATPRADTDTTDRRASIRVHLSSGLLANGPVFSSVHD